MVHNLHVPIRSRADCQFVPAARKDYVVSQSRPARPFADLHRSLIINHLCDVTFDTRVPT